MKVSILGTEYKIEYKTDEEVAKIMNAEPGDYGGCCNGFSKVITISKLDKLDDTEEVKKEIQKATLRHETIHAFLNESGLAHDSSSTSCWAKNEEMIDWFAIQSPKILKVFKETGAL